MEYNYPEFKTEEYQNRLAKLKEKMHDLKLDAVLLTGEENIRWISGYWTLLMQKNHFFPTVVIISARDSIEPVLIINSDSMGASLSWIKNVRFWDEDSSEPFYYFPTEKSVTKQKTVEIKTLIRIISEMDLGRSRIGMELGRGMRLDLDQNNIEDLKESLPNLKMVDFVGSLARLRSIKSEAEIAKLKKAAKITSDSFGDVFSQLKEGITERKVGQNFLKNWFEHGATGIGHLGVGFGDEAVAYAHSDPKEYPLKKGELVKVDIG